MGQVADTHLKRQIMGCEVVVAVTNGRLDRFGVLTRTCGRWERILCQLDGWPGSLTGGGGSGCWLESSGSSGNQSYPGGNGVWHSSGSSRHASPDWVFSRATCRDSCHFVLLLHIVI